MSTAADEIDRIEFALDALLNEIVERIKHEPSFTRQVQATPFKPISLDQIPSRDETEVNELLHDPVGSACRYAITRLGNRLYGVTKSTDVMSEVLERVAKRDSSHYGLRATIMDKSWEGVGEGNDRWGHQGER